MSLRRAALNLFMTPASGCDPSHAEISAFAQNYHWRTGKAFEEIRRQLTGSRIVDRPSAIQVLRDCTIARMGVQDHLRWQSPIPLSRSCAYCAKRIGCRVRRVQRLRQDEGLRLRAKKSKRSRVGASTMAGDRLRAGHP